MPDDDEATRYLRLRTELLERRGDAAGLANSGLAPIAEGQPADTLAREIAALPLTCRLEENREFAVYLAEAARIPLVLHEIGRLREITFRAAGEGTGDRVDLDRFDADYLHLFLWNKDKREIAGAYRLGNVPALLARHGPRGIYTESLFRFKPVSSTAWAPRSSWGGRSFGWNISGNSPRCCCCGRGSRPTWRSIPNIRP
jgi:hypothetical protein